MDIQRLVIFYNDQSWPNDGVEPKCFGGKVELTGALGKMDVLLHPNTVAAVLELVALDVVNTAQALAQGVSVDTIRRQVIGKVLEHTPMMAQAADDDRIPF